MFIGRLEGNIDSLLSKECFDESDTKWEAKIERIVLSNKQEKV